ncbi:MAG TPA: cation acetate symporter, partial [Alphaproteobacteria bacterium]|nr:cation acetate symporter [Alphaproteobacteria bacterium]
LVLGIWWKRANKQGAIVGMLAGFGITLFYLIATHYFGMGLWLGLKNISAAFWGMPLGFLAIWLVSLRTPAPSREMQDFVDSVRTPRGPTLMEEKAADA